ncbi:MAG: flagellar hook-basal body protein [Pirellulales bacterium]
MSYGMYISAEGAQAQSRRLEVIANNLANVNTVGFKPDVASFQARFAEAIQQGESQSGDRSINNLGGGVKVIDVTTNFAPGQLQRTGNDSDLAIVGNGFFAVKGGDGQTYLTRAGEFAVDAEGQLVTQNGNRPVLDSSGSPVVLDLEQPWLVTPDGSVQQGDASVELALVEPRSIDNFIKVGSNMFRSLSGTVAVPEKQREVRSGFLEVSGVNSTDQMMAMIETSRAFEANSRMIQNHDNTFGTLIGRVLRNQR